MLNSSTITQTTTYTEARARYVMDKIFEDFTALLILGFATQLQVNKWKEDLLYLMKEEVLLHFEVQLTKPNGEKAALVYYVKADNSITEDSSSGKLGLYSLPWDTKANLFADLNSSHNNYKRALNELMTNRGWGTGTAVEGETERHLGFSKEGYGVERHQKGLWN
jgi:hypothetical protein